MADSSHKTELLLAIGSYHALQYSVRDRVTGEWSTKQFEWHGAVQLKWDGKEAGAVVTATSTVEDRSGEGKKEWEKRLLHGAAALAECGSLSIFAANSVDYCLPSDEPTTMSAAASIPESYRQRLDREYETYELARRSFNYAVKRLESFAEYPTPTGYSSDAQDMYRYLRNCLAAADLGTMYSWYQEKMSMISTCMDDLARRKNRSHQGYRQAQEYIRSTLYSFHAPELWKERPPTISPETMDE